MIKRVASAFKYQMDHHNNIFLVVTTFLIFLFFFLFSSFWNYLFHDNSPKIDPLKFYVFNKCLDHVPSNPHPNPKFEGSFSKFQIHITDF